MTLIIKHFLQWLNLYYQSLTSPLMKKYRFFYECYLKQLWDSSMGNKLTQNIICFPSNLYPLKKHYNGRLANSLSPVRANKKVWSIDTCQDIISTDVLVALEYETGGKLLTNSHFTLPMWNQPGTQSTGSSNMHNGLARWITPNYLSPGLIIH